MPRDREATRARILAATERLIARHGCGAAGVNAIAKEAGVDKVLLYRYFGGAGGAVTALARDRRLWPEIASRAREEATLADALIAALLEEARELRDRPLTRAALAGSLAARTELATHLSASRDREHESLASALRERFRLPLYLDFQALVALLSAGLASLSLHADAGTPWLGVDVRTDRGRRRVEKTLDVVARAVLGGPEDS